MIYQFKVTLKGTKPPVWRRLQLDGRMTFAQLHEVLQIAFDWADLHLHSTSMMRKSGQKIRAGIGPLGDDAPFVIPFTKLHDEETETLAEWFLEEKDRALYTYNLSDDWEHEIVLEKILSPEDGIHYPHCSKAMRERPDEDVKDSATETPETDWRELTAEVNSILAETKFEYHLYEEGKPFDWSQLLTEAQALNDAAPWKDLDDNQVFAVFDPIEEHFIYCCVLGSAGQEYGLGVYNGDDGLSALKDTINDNLGEDFLIKQRSLLLAFSDRNELADEDLAFLNEHGASRQGRKQYIQLRSMVPGYVPWLVEDGEEGRLLLLAIRQTQAILEQVRNGLIIPQYEGGDEMIVRIPKQTEGTVTWDTAIARFKEPKPAAPADLYISELDIRRIQRLKTVPKSIQFGLIMLPAPVQDEPGDRPYFPLMAVAIDSEDFTAIHQDLTNVEDRQFDVQAIFAETLIQLQAIPKTVGLTQEMADMLKPVTRQLPIQVKVREELDGIEAFRNFIQHMPFG